jgi:beta-xylosidase
MMGSGVKNIAGSAKLIVIFLLVFFFSRCASVKREGTPSNGSPAIHFADPAIFPSGGKFYLYGTVEGNANHGFKAYTSTNLKEWKPAGNDSGYVLRKTDAFGTKGFWAPQVFAYNNKFYMAYVANENIAIAESSSPEGPFMQHTKTPLAAPVKQIDPFVFMDDDGRKYLYHVRLTGGNRIFVAEMTDDLTAIRPETLRECITATEDWENTARANWPVAEGPTVFKHKGTYYLVYTANDFRNPDYAVGYATSTSPLGPWKKYSGNPIISRKILGDNGTGHGDLFRKGKELYYVFHTHHSADKVGPRKTALLKIRLASTQNNIDHLEIDPSSFRFLYEKL